MFESQLRHNATSTANQHSLNRQCQSEQYDWRFFAGVVAAVKYRASCGGNQIYIHHTVNGKAYTTLFAHLLTINVKAGDKVTAGTIIAQSGGGPSTWSYDSCTTGAHLHYTVAEGFYLGVGANGYSNYNTFVNKTSPTGNASITGIKNQKGFSWSTRVF